MAWTNPTHVNTGDPPSSVKFNAETVDNIIFDFNGKSLFRADRNNGANYTLGVTGLTAVDGTNLAITLPIVTGRVRIGFTAAFWNSTTTTASLGVFIDSGVAREWQFIAGGAAPGSLISFSTVVTGLTVGSHGFTLLWGNAGGTLNMVSSATSLVTFYVEEF